MSSQNLIFLFSLLLSTQAIYISFGSKPLCINIIAEPGMEIKFFYEIIGSDGTGHRIDFSPENETQLPFSEDTAKGELKFMETTMKVCFVSINGKNHSASFDYYSHDMAHLMELALKSEVYELHTKLIDIGEKVKEVNKNEIFEETRQSVFSEIVSEQESRVQKFAFIKIVVIAVVAFAQIYLLKALLSKQDKGYQPV